MDVLSTDGHKRKPFVVGTEREIFAYLRAEQQKPVSEQKTSIYEYIEPTKPSYPTWDIDMYLPVKEVPDDVWVAAKRKEIIERFYEGFKHVHLMHQSELVGNITK